MQEVSVVEWVPIPTIIHVSASPLLIPDGRLSRVRLAAVAFPEEPSHHYPRLKHLPTYTPGLSGYILSSTSRGVTLVSGTVSGHVSPWMPATHREPLCLSDGATIVQGYLVDGLSRNYPTFIAHTGSCVRPKSSCRLQFPYFDRSLQVTVSPCWKMALPDVISAILVWVLGSLPRHD